MHDEAAPSRFDQDVRSVFPGLGDSQRAWLAQIDSLPAPDRKTHELIRLACSVSLQHPPGVRRHARLAAEVGATWEEILGSLMLTVPAFGLVKAVESIPWAREGVDAARPVEHDDDAD